ncbi:unnamed protein product [Paramecium octaurelia]|uniref:Uncharacterized protein n=1 Tax=Paramecium octaurelia TaxID=43137 RepID=A0A8S1WDP3_PAROT|nr:unnamed protein product [Paramecium octaurelia]
MQNARQEQGMNFFGKTIAFILVEKQWTWNFNYPLVELDLNVIQLEDDFGEIKFGILITLKSVLQDQLGNISN